MGIHAKFLLLLLLRSRPFSCFFTPYLTQLHLTYLTSPYFNLTHVSRFDSTTLLHILLFFDSTLHPFPTASAASDSINRLIPVINHPTTTTIIHPLRSL